MISRVKTLMDEMLLYNVKIVTYSVAGKTRESLLNLVRGVFRNWYLNVTNYSVA